MSAFRTDPFRTDPFTKSGPWRTDRCGLGFPLGAALQDTFRLNAGQSVRTVYILGDPTLRCYVTAPPTNPQPVVQNCGSGKTVHLSWTAADGADGYYVYQASIAEPEEPDAVGLALGVALGAGPIDDLVDTTQWTDPDCLDHPVSSGSYVYAVRACRLITTGAGSFYDLSPAVSMTIDVP